MLMRWFFLIYAYERNIHPDVGGFRKLWELACALKTLGHETFVFYPSLPGFSPLRDVPCRAYPVLDRPVLRPLTAYFSMLGTALAVGRCARPDVVYFRSGLNVLPLWLGRLLKAHVVLEVNADAAEFHRLEGTPRWRQRLIVAVERLNVTKSDLIVALTPGLKQMLVERYGAPEGKIKVIPSGTDPDHFPPATPEEAKTRLGLDPEQPVAGFVGLFYRHQGVHTLIEAAPRILEAVPTTRFLIVGDGVMRPQWEALAKKLNVAHAVQFTGQIPYQQIPLYLQAIDVLVAPFTADRGEVSPFKVLDALASCRPVIASALPSVRRLAEGFGDAVTLVPPDNPDALATATVTLLRDPHLRMNLGMRGREGILSHYAWEVIAREVEAAVKETQLSRDHLHQTSRRPVLRSKVASTTRTLTSWAPVLHAVPRPDRPPGVSAIVRAKDEAEWLELSIRSIQGLADEIIIGDNGSTDETPEILTKLQHDLQDQIIVMKKPDLDIKDLTNSLIERTRFRWVIRWDADFVARTDGPQSISHLRRWLFDLDPRRYVCAYLRMVELCGDVFHQRPKTASRADCHCVTYSNGLRYVYDKAGYEAPKIPRWYRVLRYEIPTFFHVDVKPAPRMFLSFLWKRYLTDPERRRYPCFKAYVELELKERWEGRGINEAAALWAASAFRELVPYDRDRFGDYPTLLKPFVEKPTYRLLYENGQIVGQQHFKRSEVSVLEA